MLIGAELSKSVMVTEPAVTVSTDPLYIIDAPLGMPLIVTLNVSDVSVLTTSMSSGIAVSSSPDRATVESHGHGINGVDLDECQCRGTGYGLCGCSVIGVSINRSASTPIVGVPDVSAGSLTSSVSR